VELRSGSDRRSESSVGYLEVLVVVKGVYAAPSVHRQSRDERRTANEEHSQDDVDLRACLHPYPQERRKRRTNGAAPAPSCEKCFCLYRVNGLALRLVGRSTRPFGSCTQSSSSLQRKGQGTHALVEVDDAGHALRRAGLA
jgi:hypothetical protein